MKTLAHFVMGATGLPCTLLACVVALNAGCRTAPPNGSAASGRVQTLDTSLSSLKAAFNRDTSNLHSVGREDSFLIFDWPSSGQKRVGGARG